VTLSANTIQEDNYGGACDFDACGSSGPPENKSATVNLPCFDTEECMWKFGGSGTSDYKWGVCTDNFTEVDGPEDVNSSNACDVVSSYRNSNGCASSGGQQYSNEACVLIHEMSHVQDFIDKLSEEAARLEFGEGFSAGSTCQDALNSQKDSIAGSIEDAIDRAGDECDEEAAEEAAKDCFDAIADDICTVYSSCSDCN